MKYLGKQVNGQATRNNFIRSMDIARNRDPDAALAAYCHAWFDSSRKQYLNEALKHVRSRSLFWPLRAIPDMLDEILLGTPPEDAKAMARDADLLKSRYTVWCSNRANRPISDEDMLKSIKQFEADYRYSCPDTFRSCWMNTGAYVTLSYGIKYEGIRFPGCATADESLALLKKLALEVVADMDHDVDDRLFRLCHAAYLARLQEAESAGVAAAAAAEA